MERDPITQQIAHLAQSSQTAAQTFTKLFRPLFLKKREVYTLDGEQSCSIIFIQSGLLCLYDNQQKSLQTMGIYRPNDFYMIPHQTCNNKLPKLQLQALQPAHIFIAESQQLQKFLQTKPTKLGIYHSIVQNYLENTMAHLQLLQAPTAVQRYQLLQQQFGKHLSEIPYKIQASYMGISRKHLSRIQYQQLNQYT